MCKESDRDSAKQNIYYFCLAKLTSFVWVINFFNNLFKKKNHNFEKNEINENHKLINFLVNFNHSATFESQSKAIFFHAFI